jgi:hypothetical protein
MLIKKVHIDAHVGRGKELGMAKEKYIKSTTILHSLSYYSTLSK